MLSSSIIARVATLGLSAEQAEAVAGLLLEVSQTTTAAELTTTMDREKAWEAFLVADERARRTAKFADGEAARKAYGAFLRCMGPAESARMTGLAGVGR